MKEEGEGGKELCQKIFPRGNLWEERKGRFMYLRGKNSAGEAEDKFDLVGK